MLQRPVRSAAARVVDQDHGGDRGAAEDIKRHHPAGSSSGFENRPYDLWTCAGYAGHLTGFYRVTGAYEMFRVELGGRGRVEALELRESYIGTGSHLAVTNRTA